LDALDPNLEYERKGRLAKYVGELDKRLEKFQSSKNRLVKWLSIASKTPTARSDDYVKNTLNEMMEEQKQSYEDVVARQKKLIEELKALSKDKTK